jgi:hypothetical protein
MGCNSTGHRRESRAAGNSSDDEGAADLGVAAETAETESEDRGEAGGFPAEDETEESDGGVAVGLGGSENEDKTHAEVEGEDIAGLDPADGHDAAGEETVECVEALG